jgi:hypothetical protein
MSGVDLTEMDRHDLAGRGISKAQIQQQIDLLRRPPDGCRLKQACTVGAGISKILPTDNAKYLQLHSEAEKLGRFIKFVPASGAATRLFQDLYPIQASYPGKADIGQQVTQGEKSACEIVRFVDNLKHFPFYEDLQETLARQGMPLETLLRHDRLETILAYLLTERGLNYGSLPKALVKFHHYGEGSRTPLEEHLEEAAQYAQDSRGACRLHFTITPLHELKFRRFVQEIMPRLALRNRATFEIDFSFQEHSTDTIAVDLDDNPLRDKYGRLLFRPGGHGALLANLNRLNGDLVYIKNIDNVVPDYRKPLVSLWNRILGGYLLEVERAVHCFIGRLLHEDFAALADELEAFVRETLRINFPETYGPWTLGEKRDFLLNKLNRPIRVCGMVPNRGEPGGGPFWVEHSNGTTSLQIVESAQVNLADPQQQAVWTSSTHFNPVNLVCSLRDFERKPFDLNRYVDEKAVFISRKSKNGKQLKALELPGLWNGSMAHWNTIFVEMPAETFSPVKTINDLLRPEHQPEQQQDFGFWQLTAGLRSSRSEANPAR